MKLCKYYKSRLLVKCLVIVLILLEACVYAQEQEKAMFFHNEKGTSKQMVKHTSYVAPLAMDFDSQNRPYMLNNTMIDENVQNGVYQVTTIRNGQWVHFSYKDELEALFPGKLYVSAEDKNYQGYHASRSVSMMIDEANNFFALVGVSIKNGTGFKVRYVLVYAHDIASDKFSGIFEIKDIFPENIASVNMEVRNSFNGSKSYAPLICYSIREKDWPYKTSYRWASNSRYSVYLINGYIKAGELKFKPHVLLDTHIGGFSRHSGGETFAVTKNNNAFMVYMRHDIDVEKDSDGNNAVYVNCLNRDENKLNNKRIFLFESTPSFADIHSTPVIGIGKWGHLYVQGGAHANNPTGEFKNTRSKRPLDITEWQAVKDIGFNRTYTCLLIDENNKKHTFFRSSNPYKLYYQSGTSKDGYANNNGVLFVDQNSKDFYRVYYHHLHKGRKNRIYVSWTVNNGADNNTWDFRRVLAFSDNSGCSWEIATKEGFINKISDEIN